MSTEFYKEDDYLEIIPPSFRGQHNHMKALIESAFYNEKAKASSLLFCLFERVTITNKTGIGDTYIYSHLSKTKERELYQKYKNIIKEVQEERKVNPTEYIEWYKHQKSFFLIDYNKDSNDSFEDGSFDWSDNYKPDNPDDNKISIELKKDLAKDEIEKYLHCYAEKLRNKLQLSTYPYYAVIVKPVCVVNEETGAVYPLGNLFLHFGTKDEKPKAFYITLINKFMIVWFRVHGCKLIEEIEAATIQKFEQEKTDESHLPQLSNRAKKRLTEKLNGSLYSLTDYFNKHKNSTNHRDGFKKEVEKLKSVVIPYLLHHTIHRQAKEPIITDIEDLQRDAITGLKDLDTNFDLFIQILLRRKLFCVCYFLFNYDIRNIHSFLTGTNLTSQTSSNIDSVYNYFLINLAISIGKEKKWDDYKKLTRKIKIFKQLTKEEKDFLNDCLEHIKSFIDNGKINSFNDISHLKITTT